MTLLPDNLLPNPRADLRPRQADAIDAARQRPMPSADADEDWRYSRIDDLHLDELQPGAPRHQGLSGAARQLAEALDGAPVHGVIEDGVVTDWSAATEAVSIVTDTGPVSWEDDDAFGLLNAALSPATHTVAVRPGEQVAGPVVVVDISSGSGNVAAPSLRFLADDRSTVTLVHLVVGRGPGAIVPATDIIVGDGAQVSVVTVHVAEPQSWVIGRLSAEVGHRAHLSLHCVSLGGYYSRMAIDASLNGEGSELDNRGLYLGAGTEMHDYRVTQRHVGRHTRSRLTLRGAVRDRAEGVFTGVVRMERGAKAAAGNQDARHLILEDGAHVDSIPSLEIEENDVTCSHASSISPVDADQVFYLESRGVPTGDATRLIARGFLRAAETGVEPTDLATVVGDLLAATLAPAIAPLIR